MSKEKEEEYTCPHEVALTVEEEDALNWLKHSLEENARKCSPTSRMSAVASGAVAKLFKKQHELHDMVHALEAELVETEMLVTGMVGLPHSLGLVKEEDLN